MQGAACGPGPLWTCDPKPGAPLDIAVQAPSQSLAHRAVCYFTNGSPLVPAHLVPARAEEPGPRTNKDGPGLALLKDVAATPAEFLAWFTEQSWLTRACSRVYFLPQGGTAVRGGTGDAIAAQIAAAGMPNVPIRVQACPRKCEYAIADALDKRGFNLEPRVGAFAAVLSVVRVDQDAWRFAYTPASCMWRVPSDGKRTHADLSSSAVNKLHEALLTCGHADGELGAVIDLGAAPGAWSELLAQRAQCVIAVDPAQLSENCAALPNVRHIRRVSQDAVEDVRHALGGGLADLIVCDMIQPPHFCVECIKPLLPLLRVGGHVIMTCKFIGHARDRSGFEAELRGLEAWSGFEAGTLVWLMANTNQERTWIVRKACAAGPAGQPPQAEQMKPLDRKKPMAINGRDICTSKQRRIERGVDKVKQR